jgi:hypothetical protein
MEEDILEGIKDYVLSNYGFKEIPEAIALGINHRHFEISGKEISRHMDIYSMLESLHDDQTFRNYDYLTIVSNGWAASLAEVDENTSPRMVENRRRVSLMLTSDNVLERVIGSTVVFHDDKDNPLHDVGTCEGLLNEAVKSIYY